MVYESLGMDVPGHAPIVWDSHDPETVQCGFMQRLLRKTPLSEDLLLGKLKTFVSRWCEKNLNTVVVGTFEEWLEGTSYTDARKEELRRARDVYHGGRPPISISKRVKSFVKTEGYGKYKHCRLINSRTDFFKAWSGRFFKAIEEELFKNPYFIKHVPVDQRAALIAAMKKAGLHYYITDYTAFESHMIPKIMRVIEVVLYMHCLKNYPKDADYLVQVILGENKMSVRGVASAKCEARRMSGEMNTSCGNGFTNLMLALFTADESGTTIEPGYGYFEGDDGLFATAKPIDASIFKRCGFSIKLVEVESPTNPIPVNGKVDPSIAFCGMVCSEDKQMIREPRKFLQTFGWTHSFIGAGDLIRKELLRGKAICALYEMPSCPVVTELATLALRRTSDATPRFVDDGYHKPPTSTPSPAPITNATRELFTRMYGISVEEQLSAEAAIRSGDLSMLASIIQPSADMQHYYARYVETG